MFGSVVLFGVIAYAFPYVQSPFGSWNKSEVWLCWIWISTQKDVFAWLNLSNSFSYPFIWKYIKIQPSRSFHTAVFSHWSISVCCFRCVFVPILASASRNWRGMTMSNPLYMGCFRDRIGERNQGIVLIKVLLFCTLLLWLSFV